MEPCRVYWGSHGCKLPRGHEGQHICECFGEIELDLDVLNVGGPPYYGAETTFYGDDVGPWPSTRS